MPRKPRLPQPAPVLQFDGISETQWQFLRLRGFDAADAESARGAAVSTRTVEGWKRRSTRFRALYAFALGQPRLFATGALRWSLPAAPTKSPHRTDPTTGANLVQSALLLAREQPDAAFQRALRERQFAVASLPENTPPPPVDLEVPDQYRVFVKPEAEMKDGERRLAAALGVEHLLVRGYWNGQASPLEPSWYEHAVVEAAEITPGFRMPRWYPDGVVFTSVGMIVLFDARHSPDLRCPMRRRRRCPHIDLHGANFASCSYWDISLKELLDSEPPAHARRSAICDRDFVIARLLAYLATVTRRSRNMQFYRVAGFPVIAVRDGAEMAPWQERAADWNRILVDPWRQVRVVDAAMLVDAVADWRVRSLAERTKEAGDDAH